MIHELKIWPEYFAEVKSGNKTFEIRKSDRDYRVGDILRLREFYPKGVGSEGEYSGEECLRKISYIYSGPIGVAQGYVILGLKLMAGV